MIGSGPIVIGQACEFDYSGTQACRVLRAEGIRVSPGQLQPGHDHDRPGVRRRHLRRADHPRVRRAGHRQGSARDAILATLGGQTALNTAVALHERGVLEKYGVELIGANIAAIQHGEDRQMFKDIVRRRSAATCRGRAVCHSMDEVRATVAELGLPVVIRPSFTMGGLGSGMAHTTRTSTGSPASGLAASPVHEVLIEESVLGWKEYELELMRDRRTTWWWSARSRTSTRWACTPATRSPWPRR